MPDPRSSRENFRPQPPPDADAAAHGARVAAHLRSEIARAGGWIGFDRFMELALYAPGLGYYAAGAAKFGPAGDFVTAPEISPLFGRAIAAQVAQVALALGGGPVPVLEFGAGTGALAGQVIAELARRGCPLARYLIVETSPDLQGRQRRALAVQPLRWLDAPPDRFTGVILANEVLDVMPVKLFARRGAGVLERGVAIDGDLELRLADRPAGEELAAAVAAIEEEEGGEVPDGYGSEVGLVARGWIRSLAQWLERGAALLIDYGFPAREYYHPQRIMGTLMCHYRHQAHADPLWWPGLNDITAHVDFSAIAAVAHASGLDVLGYTSQAHFLLNCGLLELLGGAPSAPARAGVQRLISEAEMGELVKVLALGRGLDLDRMLVGFERGDRLGRL